MMEKHIVLKNFRQNFILFFLLIFSSFASASLSNLGLSDPLKFATPAISLQVVLFYISVIAFSAAKLFLINVLVSQNESYKYFVLYILISPLTFCFTDDAFTFFAFCLLYLYMASAVLGHKASCVLLPLSVFFCSLGTANTSVLFIVLAFLTAIYGNDRFEQKKQTPSYIQIAISAVLLIAGEIVRKYLLKRSVSSILNVNEMDTRFAWRRISFAIVPILIYFAPFLFASLCTIFKKQKKNKHSSPNYKKFLIFSLIVSAAAFVYGIMSKNYMVFGIIPYNLMLFVIFVIPEKSMTVHPVILSLNNFAEKHFVLFICILFTFFVFSVALITEYYSVEITLFKAARVYF